MTRSRKTDAEIQHDVLQELEWDPRVSAPEVGVEVDHGVVTLTGTVTSWAGRAAADEAARRVIDVFDVVNDLVVTVPRRLTRTDIEMAHAVRRALEWDVFVPEARITSTVMDAWVTLGGTVENGCQRADAERAVRNLKGLKGVLNAITVNAAPPVTDDLGQAIEQALARRAAREARRVRVDVHDGIATLTGAVHSWAERKSAVAAARFTRGVRDVEDGLRVEPVWAPDNSATGGRGAADDLARARRAIPRRGAARPGSRCVDGAVEREAA